MEHREESPRTDHRNLKKLTDRAFWLGVGLGIVLGLVAGMVMCLV